MNYNTFEKRLLSEIKKNKSKCLKTIENNEKIVKEYLTKSEKPIHIKEFIKKLIEIIVIDLKKYNLVENVLKHELFTDVLEEFRNSTVLIRAIKRVNKNAIKWLMTMNINLYVQDENGMTALMHIVERKVLEDIVEELLKIDNGSIYLLDNNGENILFHSVGNEKIFEKLLNFEIDINHLNKNDENILFHSIYNEKVFKKLLNSDIDINQINKNNETILTYCCRNNIFPCFYDMIKKLKVDPDYINNEGRTAAMHLVQNGKFEELSLLSITKFNVNFQNVLGENLPSILVNQFKEIYAKDYSSLLYYYVHTLRVLIDLGCNLNVPIDEEGNTLIMYFLMIEEYFTVSYLFQIYKGIDFSVKNRNGLSASFLIVLIDQREELIINNILTHKTFDISAYDKYHNNLLIQYIVRNDTKGFFNILKKITQNKEALNMVNDKGENALIIAVKLGHNEFLCKLFLQDININQQDELGNTALYYAIQLKNKISINMLMNYKADINIKNKQGVSPLDLANEINDESIMNILNHPVPLNEMDEKFKEKKSLFNNKKTTDEKVEDYIKNYRIKNYQSDYNYIIENTKKSYPTYRYGIRMEDKLFHIYRKLCPLLMDLYTS